MNGERSPATLRRRDESRLGVFVNVGGVVLASILLGVALVRLRWVTATSRPIVHDPIAQLRAFAQFDPVAWASIGCLLLTATPVVRVLLLAIAWIVARRGALAIAALVVVAVLVAGIAIAWPA